MNFMKERTVTMNRECILEQAKQHDSFYLYEEAIIRKNTEQLKTDFPGRAQKTQQLAIQAVRVCPDF